MSPRQDGIRSVVDLRGGVTDPEATWQPGEDVEPAATEESASHAGPYLWVLRRLALGVVVLLLVSIIVFAATQALPSDPARAILGKFATPQQLQSVRQQLGLDRSLPSQYLHWLGGVVTGNFGESFASRGPVSALLGTRVIYSFTLLCIVMCFTVPIAVGLGAYCAIRRDKGVDRVASMLSLGGIAVPDFVVGMVLVVLLATTVTHLLPAVTIISPGSFPLLHPLAIALPVMTLVILTIPYLFRLVRATTIDVLESDYVTWARLKGMPERTVLVRHALPNALIPVVQGAALTMVYLLGSVVVIEYLFDYPGMGGLLASSIESRDLPVIQAVTLVFAAGVVCFNLVADVLTVYLTPKLRTTIGER